MQRERAEKYIGLRYLLNLVRLHPSVAVLLLATNLIGCIKPYDASRPYPTGAYASPSGTSLVPPGQTTALESDDRVSRFRRLAGLNGVTPPEIEEIVALPRQGSGLDRPVPVLRIAFDEKMLFDSDSVHPRPQSAQILDLIADSMRRDVPDAQMTLLGHTDAVGTDSYNDDLSLRRAQDVFQSLVDRGGNAAQLSTVAVGKKQPIASNATTEGRARNRRVELLISASLDANLAVVRQRVVNPAYLSIGTAPARVNAVSTRLAVLRPLVYSGPSDFSEAKPNGRVELQPVGALTLAPALPSLPPVALPPLRSIEPRLAPTPPIQVQPARPPTYEINVPTEPNLAPLGPAVPY